MRVAIDGPAAAGKSTVAKQIAKKLDYLYIDTGAMYRALTLIALRNQVNLEDEEALADLASQINISFRHKEDGQDVLIDGDDVSDDIRQSDVTNNVSIVAKHKLVREHMVEMQRKLADEANVVVDGRDIGTYVLPNAEVKIFLVASVEERAIRRHKENVDRGISSDLEQLKEEIERRDQIDSQREMAPLTKADDAIEIDTTSKSIEEVKESILTIIQDHSSFKGV
ncbi:(d)CMP kinase [Alkalibacillus haloalkaliphilus]|uniref:Cytidylate kinase n=1 Tax=Alkalibacillus haloalkaliphilus TaxID=94136 RepID=A0A511W245_9BACI|nr:(d)CMP kinase [Alkalibacillus haloalkaliphilus]GEN45170.1 cytidylate kinase [Alkalibacillus haloalkaliphilus]